MEDGAGCRFDEQGAGLCGGVSNRQPANRERPQLNLCVLLYDGNGCMAAFAAELCRDHMSGKASGVDRAPKLLPEQMNGSDVILVRVGCNESD